MSDYNDWPNRATWVIPLWVDNDEWTYHYRLNSPVDTVEGAREFVENLKQVSPLIYRGIMMDLGSDTLDDVNWEKIVEAWNE